MLIHFMSLFIWINAALADMNDINITEENFANIILPKVGNVSIKQYTLTNGFLSVSILSYGSTIRSITMPSVNGTIDDIDCGFDDIHGYLSSSNPYFGATVGRVANRIKGGKFKIGNEEYTLSKNAGPNTLHGGFDGFNKKYWNSSIEGRSVVMNYKSENLEEGFPGNLDVEAKYTLTQNNELVICYTATTDKTTPVNIVNHSYFNIAGVQTGAEGLYQHDIVINADEYTPVTESLIPTGQIASVQDTPYNLRENQNLGQKIRETPSEEGFDINFVVRGTGFRQVARITHEPTGRFMEVFSDQPGVQFYTSNGLEDVKGKNNVYYQKHGAFCLETQNFPDAVNQKNFPSPFLEPGKLYKSTVVYQFGILNENPE